MLIFGMPQRHEGDEDTKRAIVRECALIDDPRSPKDYIDNLMTWDFADLKEYLERRRRERTGLGSDKFRPHP